MGTDLPLRDIHLPTDVGYWPPAPGWWLLCILLIVIPVITWRFWQRRRLRRLALARLREIEVLPDKELAPALSRLLRQAAISHFPQETAGLSGQQWLEFLDRPFADQPFSLGVGRSLIDAPYRADAQIDGVELIGLCRRWLKKLPPQPMKQGRG